MLTRTTERASYGGLTTMYSTDEPTNCGWYQVDPHCWYEMPLTTVVEHDGGSAYVTDPIAADVIAPAAKPAAAAPHPYPPQPWSTSTSISQLWLMFALLMFARFTLAVLTFARFTLALLMFPRFTLPWPALG
jgi:hypothetical protein